MGGHSVRIKLKAGVAAPLFYLLRKMVLHPLWSGFSFLPHQQTGVTWMLERERGEAPGGILCDEMGLGKTIQVIGLLKNGIRRAGEKTLLIAPVAVLEQWKKVAWKTRITVKIPSEYDWVTEGERGRVAAELYCIGYEAAVRRPWLVTGAPWARLVVDEAHRIAGGNTATDLVQRIQRASTWLLTGTPIVNKTTDFVTLLKVLGLKNIPGGFAAQEPLIKKYVLARTMEQLRASIPSAPKKAQHVYKSLEFLNPAEETFYHDKADVIANRLSALGGRGTMLQRLKLIMRLRQVSLHPQVYNEARKNQLGSAWDMPDWAGSSAKFEAIRQLLVEAKTSHKWIVFCHFRHEMQMLEEMLRGESVVEIVQQYHGGLTAAQKEDVLERSLMPIMEGKQEVLLVQLQSGGTGLNLQHFDQIIFTGPWWTKALMDQAVGRAVRIGQTKQVVVYHLHLKAEEDSERLNIDRFMAEKADAKGALCEKVLQGATTTVLVEDLSSHK
jgi:SNF2 family DNA or RNA helicase